MDLEKLILKQLETNKIESVKITISGNKLYIKSLNWEDCYEVTSLESLNSAIARFLREHFFNEKKLA